MTSTICYRLVAELLELLRMEYRHACDNAVLPLGMAEVLDEYDSIVPDDIRDILRGYADIPTTELRQECLKRAAGALKLTAPSRYGHTLVLSLERKTTLAKWCVAKHTLVQKQREYEQIREKPHEPIEYTYPDGTPVEYVSRGSGGVNVYSSQKNMEQAERIVKGLRIRLTNQQ